MLVEEHTNSLDLIRKKIKILLEVFFFLFEIISNKQTSHGNLLKI